MVALTWRQLAHDVDDAIRRLVVEDPPPGPSVGAPGQEDADLGLPVGQLGGQLERGPPQAAVGAVDDVERQAGEPHPLPPLDEDLGPLVVDVEVHGPEVVGHQGAGVLDGPGGGQVDAVDEDDHDVAAQDLGLAGLDGDAFFEHDVLDPVLAVGPRQ